MKNTATTIISRAVWITFPDRSRNQITVHHLDAANTEAAITEAGHYFTDQEKRDAVAMAVVFHYEDGTQSDELAQILPHGWGHRAQHYVTCTRADMPKFIRERAEQIEKLGFTVEHHRHVKGGNHASRILRAGEVLLDWSYGSSLSDFLKGAQAMTTPAPVVPAGWDKISADDPIYFLGTIYSTARRICCDVLSKDTGRTFCTVALSRNLDAGNIQQRAEMVLHALNQHPKAAI